jgi:hypothetical protein
MECLRNPALTFRYSSLPDVTSSNRLQNIAVSLRRAVLDVADAIPVIVCEIRPWKARWYNPIRMLGYSRRHFTPQDHGI